MNKKEEKILETMKGARVRYVRTQNLHMSQQEFAQKLGVTQQTVGQIENGKIILTSRNFDAICRIFNVNPKWLEMGEGETFKTVQEKTYFEMLCEEYELDGLSKQVFERYLSFPPEQRQIIADWILKTFDFVEDLAKELQSKKAERKKQLEAAVAAGEDAKKELEKMEADARADLVKDSLSETG